MPLILIIVALAALRYFEVGPFASLSWWWMIGLFCVSVLWFEFLEPALGLNKKKSENSLEEARKARVEKTFKK